LRYVSRLKILRWQNSIYKNKNYYGIACVDLTTGEFLSTHITFGNTFNKLMDEIAKFSPSEIVVNGEFFHDENIKKKEFSIQKVRNYFKDYVIEENAFEESEFKPYSEF